MAKITIPQVGETYVGTNPGVMKVARVTVGVSSGNPDVIIEATGSYPIFTVPAGCVVTGVRARILEAFTATCNLNVGDSDDTDGFLTESVIACTAFSSDTVNVLKRNAAAGGYLDTTGADGGRAYDVSQDISAVIDTAAPTVGKAEIYLFYTEAGLL